MRQMRVCLAAAESDSMDDVCWVLFDNNSLSVYEKAIAKNGLGEGKRQSL